MSERISVSEEQFVTTGDGTEICYQTFGDPGADPLLLVMGLGGPMTWWHDQFCRDLARHGFFVIRYDNRDTGRSTKFRQTRVRRSDLVRAFARRPGQIAYTMSQMAEDGLAILDALGLHSAHVTGVSMGGMIAQTLTVEHPDRVRSLVSIMSTTGSRRVGFQHPKLFPALLAPRHGGREQYVENAALFWPKIGSPAYPTPAEESREQARVTWDRGFSASGVVRQMIAVLTQPDRTAALREVKVPAAVVHGLADPMVHPSGGRATARALGRCELMLVPGMGHDLPKPLWPQFIGIIRRTADRAAKAG